MKRFFRAVAFAIVVLCSVFVQSARADFSCLPMTASTIPLLAAVPADKVGSTTVEVFTSAGSASGFWCRDPVSATTPAGKVTYSMQVQWALDKYKGHPDLRAAFARVMAAPNLLDAVNGEVRAGSITPAAGSQDAYEVALLKFKACTALATPPYLVPIDPLPANFCGAAPVPPAPSTDVWRTTAAGPSTVFTYANGKLTGIVSGKKAAPSTLCDCRSTKAVVGAKTFCAISGGPSTEATECIKQ